MTHQLLFWVTISIWVCIGLLLIVGVNEIAKLRLVTKVHQPAPDTQIAGPHAWVLIPKSFGKPADETIRSQFVFEKVRQKCHEELHIIKMPHHITKIPHHGSTGHRYMATQNLPRKRKFTRQGTAVTFGPGPGKRYGENQAWEPA
jgi:hypothetical protein